MSSPETEFINILTHGAGDAGAEPVPPLAKALPEKLPILGLSDIVIFPGMVAPLLVETSQSVRLIDDVVAGDRMVGLVLQKKAEFKPYGVVAACFAPLDAASPSAPSAFAAQALIRERGKPLTLENVAVFG